MTGGTDAQAEVTVRLEDKMGKITSGHGANTDTLLASAKAYLGALNKIIYNESLTHQAKNLSI